MIKEFIRVSNGNHVVIRNETYRSQLNGFEKLFEIAKTDFPSLNSSDVTVVHYGGKRISGYFGIEFLVSENPPKDYTEVQYLEPTL